MMVRDLRELQGDLTKVLQTATDASIPVIIEQKCSASGLQLSLQVDSDLTCFRGHFPGHPVLPGVVQVQWAVEISRLLLDFCKPPGEILRLKFKSIIVPPQRVELLLARRSAADITFDYFSGDNVYSQGLLRFDENRA